MDESNSREVLCNSVRNILQDSNQRDHVLHNSKSIKGAYTNAAVAQILLSNFEPSYKHDAKIKNREFIESNRNIHKFTNWCFSIKSDRETEKKQFSHQPKKVLSMRNIFEKSLSEKSKPVLWRSWVKRCDQLRASSKTIKTTESTESIESIESIEHTHGNLEESDEIEFEILSRSMPKPDLIPVTNLDESRYRVPRRASAA